MPAGYIRIDQDLQSVLNEVQQKLTPLDCNELITEEHEKCAYDCVVYLYATSGQSKLPKCQGLPPKSETKNNRPSTDFLSLGWTVHRMFTKKNKSRQQLTFKKINPGTPVYLLCTRVKGFLKGTQNPLWSTGDLLIPCVRLNMFRLPPADVNLCSFVYFDFLVTNFQLIQAVPRDMCCRGKLCDSQCVGNTCPCLVAN